MGASAIRRGAYRFSPEFRFFAWEESPRCCSSTAPLQCFIHTATSLSPKGPAPFGFSFHRSRSIGSAMDPSSDHSLKMGLFVMGFSSEAFLVEEPVHWQASDTCEVAVFWDLNDCAVPDEIDPFRIGPNIVMALKMSGLSGPIAIHAYGSTRRFNEHNLVQALIATGIDLHHVPGGERDSNNRLLVDLLLWVKKNPPPAHAFLISGDKNFSGVLHKLQMKGYNVLLAYPEGGLSPALLNSASRVWAWDGIMKGVSLVARSWKNGTPVKDGKWYGANNISQTVQGYVRPQAHHNQDCQLEVGTKSESRSFETKAKIRHIPHEAVEQVLDIVKLKPYGLTLAAFRRQISKSNFLFDKDLYGHKDLLSFLLSIPRLNANLFWTSDRTRTYLFTVDDTKTAGMPAVSELASSSAQHIKSKDGKYIGMSGCDSVKMGPPGDVTEERRQLSCSVGAVSDSVRQESVSNEIWVDSSSPDFPSNVCVKDQLAANQDDTAKSVALPSADRGVISARWNRAFSKLNFLDWFFEIMGFKVLASNAKLQEELLTFKNVDHNHKNKLKEEGKLINASNNIRMPISCKIAEKPVVEGRQIGLKWKKSAQKESGLGFSNNKVTAPAQKIKSESFSRKLWRDVDFFVRCIEGRTAISRMTTIKDVVKHLKESNLSKVANFQEEQLFQFAKILIQEKQLLQVHAKSANPVAKEIPELAVTGSRGQSITAAETDLDSEVVLEMQDTTLAIVRSEADMYLGSPSGDSEATGSTKFVTDLMAVSSLPSDTESPSHLESNAKVSSYDHCEDWVKKGDFKATDSTKLMMDPAVVSLLPLDTELSNATPSFDHFKDWVGKVLVNVRSIDQNTLLDKFQEDFNVVLDHEKYGFSNVDDLINATGIAQSLMFSNGLAVIVAKSKGRKYYEEQKIGDKSVQAPMEDLKEMLQDVFLSCEHGFPLSDLKGLFKGRYGYDLHNKALGYRTLASLVRSLDQVAVYKNETGGFVMPKFSVPMEDGSDILHEGDESQDEERK